MKIEKHIEAIKETLDTINSALEDEEGLIKYQRRIALMISLGIAELVELYFHKLNIIKEGARLKHDWFKKRDIKKILSNQITTHIENVSNIDIILEICKKIEDKRNDLAYSSPIEEDEILREEISSFLEIKKLIEDSVGELGV